MHPRHFLPAGLALLLFAQISEPAQPPNGGPSRMVEVNVIVRDKNGPVNSLTQDDFTIFDKGKEQRIAFFSSNSGQSARKPDVPLPPGVWTNHPEQFAEAPLAATIVLFDAVNMEAKYRPLAQQDFLVFLKRIKPQDHIAVYAMGNQFRVLNDYTSDDSRLPSAIDAWMHESAGLVSQFSEFARMPTTAAALEAIANHVGRLPGRKNLIWVAGIFSFAVGEELPESNRTPERRGINEAMNRAARALSDANIAVYPVAAQGLTAGTEQASVQTGASKDEATIRLGQNHLMDLMADNTGGRAFYNNNDLGGAILKAVEDSQATYTLAFVPDAKGLDSKFHSLKVQVKDKGLEVRYRKGFLATPIAPLSDSQRNADIRSALESPLEAAGLTLNVETQVIDQPKPGTLGVRLGIPPGEITFQSKNGQYAGALDFAYTQRTAEGAEVKDTPIADQPLTFTLDQARYDTVMKLGVMTITRSLDLLPGATQLRVVLFDRGSGKFGSLVVPLQALRRQAKARHLPGHCAEQ